MDKELVYPSIFIGLIFIGIVVHIFFLRNKLDTIHSACIRIQHHQFPIQEIVSYLNIAIYHDDVKKVYYGYGSAATKSGGGLQSQHLFLKVRLHQSSTDECHISDFFNPALMQTLKTISIDKPVDQYSKLLNNSYNFAINIKIEESVYLLEGVARRNGFHLKDPKWIL